MPQNESKKGRRGGQKSNPRKSNRASRRAPRSGSASMLASGVTNTFVPGYMSDHYRTRLRFGAASIAFSASTGLVGRYVYAANGLFDPSITGGSLQPAGFAQLMLSYNHYYVTSATIRVMFTNNSNTPAIVGLAINADAVGSSDPSNTLELPREQFTDLTPVGVYGSTKTLTLRVSIAEFLGTNPKDNPQLRGNVSSNPVEMSYFHCWAYGLKGSNADFFMNVDIDYTAVFCEPRDLGPSLTAQISRLLIETEQKVVEEDRQKVLPGVVSVREVYGGDCMRPSQHGRRDSSPVVVHTSQTHDVASSEASPLPLGNTSVPSYRLW